MYFWMDLATVCREGNRCARVGPNIFACFLTIECRTRIFFRRAMWSRHLAPPKERSPVKGQLPKENHWSAPAAWRAVVRDGLIAEWQVYADIQSARKIMGVQNP